MTSVARLGDTTLPHGQWSMGVLISGSPNVIVNGKPVCRLGDVSTPHTHPVNPPHASIVSAGSSTVLVNGMPIARMGDPMTCGTIISMGSANVIAGG